MFGDFTHVISDPSFDKSDISCRESELMKAFRAANAHHRAHSRIF